jgi:hypothetical protein
MSLGLSRFTDNQAQVKTIAALASVPNVAGSGSASVTTAVTTSFSDQYGTGLLPPSYAVIVTPSQSCVASVSGKTSSGFNVVLQPLTGNSILVGTFDVVVVG